MKKQKGFTLIELVIVIIILGILASTAIPKFIQLQDDARTSAMKGVKATLEGAATLTYTKASLASLEKDQRAELLIIDKLVNIQYGYPKASEKDLTAVADFSSGDWVFKGEEPVQISVLGSSDVQCHILYSSAEKYQRPKITLENCL